MPLINENVIELRRSVFDVFSKDVPRLGLINQSNDHFRCTQPRLAPTRSKGMVFGNKIGQRTVKGIQLNKKYFCGRPS